MNRRAATAQTAALTGLDPAYVAAKERLAAGKLSKKPIPQRKYGRTKRRLSIIGFGGMVVKVSSLWQAMIIPCQHSRGKAFAEGR